MPGVDGVDIGGDWYDVIDVGGGQVILVVGDVSGRGLRAATEMASLRYAIRAYAAQGDPPEVILSKLSRLINLVRDGHFATVLCGLVNVAERRVTFANAGHPSPLLDRRRRAPNSSRPVSGRRSAWSTERVRDRRRLRAAGRDAGRATPTGCSSAAARARMSDWRD